MKPDAESPALEPQALTGEAQREALMELHRRAGEALSAFLKISPRPKEDSRRREMVFQPQQGITLRVDDHYHYQKLIETDPVLGSLDNGVKISSSGRMRLTKANALGHFHGPGSSLSIVWFENGYVRHMSDGDTALIAYGRGNIYPRENDLPTVSLRECRDREREYGVEIEPSSIKEPQQSTVDRFLASLDEMRGYLGTEFERREAEREAVVQQPSEETRKPLFGLFRRFW